MDDLFDEYGDEIRDEVYSRSSLDVVEELIVYTDDIPIQVGMLSDCDYISSHWSESQGGYRYEESCFGDMVDSLNLNSARVKKALTRHDYKTYGHFPNRKNRSGRRQVSYKRFYEELINSYYEANLLTHIGRMNLRKLYETGFSLEGVIILKGNYCGLFDSIYGGGNLLEMELKKNVRLELEVRNYHGFCFQLDDERSKYGYSIWHVYGIGNSLSDEGISPIAS